jgi:type I restriction enzyme S subunit
MESFVRDFPVPLPPLAEQQAIAAYLDGETARLDALAARYRRLLALLDEKRRALITHAVTRGLNPAAPLKDSGIEWLGDIPAHWEESKIKFGFDIRLGKMLQPQPASSKDTLEPYLRAANVFWEGITMDDIQTMWFSPYEKTQYEIFPGDLIVCEGGDVGRSAIWEGQIPHCYIQNAVHRISAKPGFINKYLYYWLYMLKTSGYIDLICSKATISHLTGIKLANLPFVSLPLAEQQAIAAYLDRETARLDDLKAKIETLLARLGEHRAALISAAVTGKMDVHRPAG